MFKGELEQEAEIIEGLVEEIRAEVEKNKFDKARYTLVKIKTQASKMESSLKAFVKENQFSHLLLSSILDSIGYIIEKCRTADGFLSESANRFDRAVGSQTPRQSFGTVSRIITRHALDIIGFSKSIRREMKQEF